MSFFQKFSSYFEHIHQKKIKNFIKQIPITTLIDVGAYHGNFINNLNLNLLKRIFAFEPDKKNCDFIKKNFNKIKVYNFCLAEKKYLGFFLINKDRTTSTLEKNVDKKSLLYKVKEEFLNLKYYKRVLVKVNTLDNVIKKVDGLSFLKIDVEGGDLNVLLGAKKIINKIHFILIEIKLINFYKNNNKNKIYEFLHKKHFIKKKVFCTFPFFYLDVLFEKKVM